MIDTPNILRTARQMTAVIHVTVPREEIRTVMGPGLSELKAALAAQVILPTGPWFTHHLKMDAKTFDFEIGVPVDQAVAVAGRVKPGELPAATVARTIYHGPYEGLHTAWREFSEWILAQGKTCAPSLWETYLTDPEANPDTSTWRTELSRPLMD